jgi:hypothetical protein
VPVSATRRTAYVLFDNLIAMAQPDSLKAPPPKCTRCAGNMSPLYRFLDPHSGKQVRVFRCECGERTLSYE